MAAARPLVVRLRDAAETYMSGLDARAKRRVARSRKQSGEGRLRNAVAARSPADIAGALEADGVPADLALKIGVACADFLRPSSDARARYEAIASLAVRAREAEHCAGLAPEPASRKPKSRKAAAAEAPPLPFRADLDR